MRTLTVLLWKDLMRSKRNIISVLYQMISPLLITVLILLIRKELSKSNASSVMVKLKENMFQDNKSPATRCILYTPDSKLAGSLMNEVGNQLGLVRLTTMPNESSCNGYYPYSNYSEIAEFVLKYKNEAVIRFEDMDAESWSSRQQDRLTYTIRMDDKFKTHAFASPGAQKPYYGHIYDDFIRIQWAIDTSYIKVRTGKNVTQKLTVQEFPHFRETTPEELATAALYGVMFTYAMILSVLNLYTHIMSRMLCERAAGIQELIKMNGVTPTDLGLAYFINSLPPALSFSLGVSILMKLGEKPLIQHTSAVFIFIGLALYAVSILAFGMACSYIVNRSRFATVIGVFIYIATIVVLKYVREFPPDSRTLLLMTGLLWHIPLFWMFVEIYIFEATKKPMTISDLNYNLTGCSVLEAYVFLILQSLMYFALTWYLSYVRQGKYGNSLPWNFPCKKKQDESAIIDKYRESPEQMDMRYFEEPPQNRQVGIKIINVSKYYPKPALSDVSLDVYKGEITVLLGHNGAGKTTLMSIITGLIRASQGTVLVNGLDSESHSIQIRKHMGFCPQHNLFIDRINVIEHVMFFNMLKGKSKDPRATALELLQQLGIGNKAFDFPEDLSGGMKRRLQLACALAGGSDVLVLDEPTSGLDVETRRELWNLLLSLRGERTVLLSTHFMEEADALGDRVAALHTGQLRCHATPMFLKKAMGGGYRLSFVTSGLPKEAAITAVVTKYVSDATARDNMMNTITYNLPSTATSQFPNLFAALETKRTDLEIDSIGVGISTMEEVFLFLCSDSEAFIKEEMDTTVPASEYGKIKGRELYKRQAIALIKRHFHFLSENIIAFPILHIIVPAILIFIFALTCNIDDNDIVHELTSETDIIMNLDVYKPSPRRAFINVNATGASMSAKDAYEDIKIARSRNISNDLYKIGNDSRLQYNKYLVGVELDDKHAKALYNPLYLHTAPVAINLLSNVLASQFLPIAGAHSITTHYHPLDDALYIDAKSYNSCLMWAALVSSVIMFASFNFHALPTREGLSGARHLHVMAGCPAALHWLCTLTFHTALTLLTVVLIAVICAYVCDEDETFRNARFLCALTLILILGNIAFFGFMYLVYIYIESKAAAGVLIFLILWGVFMEIMKVIAQIQNEKFSLIEQILIYVSNMLPSYAMPVAVAYAAYTARLNALCELNKQFCPNIGLQEPGFDADMCCADESKAYLSFDEFAPGQYIVLLLIQGILFMTLVILTQIGYLSCFIDGFINKNFKPEPLNHVDELVAAEANHVDQKIKLTTEQIVQHNQAMLVSHLHKNYFNYFNRLHAVKGISFSVKKGECFGLLGLNGAGKSTTFKMLTAEICPTAGRIFGNGFFLHKEKKKYLRTIGYCPQFLGIDDFQTGNNNLRTLLTIRGLDDNDIEKEIKAWIAVVGLQKYANMRAASYSGGYKRRLAAAAALCSGAPLSLLDEPTAGVDVGARRLVHTALRKALALGDSIIITSHSMDEMEALCSRIAIMAAGKIRALGTPAQLRSKYAQGYALMLKLKHLFPQDSGGESQVDKLKDAVAVKFDCVLKDEHTTMLHYHIKDELHLNYSDIFSKLEALRIAFPDVIEDYSVSETTLEEVFLHLAKEHMMEKQAQEEAELVAKRKQESVKSAKV